MAKKPQQSNYLAACQKFGVEPKVEPKTESYPGEVHDYHYHVLRVCIAAENAIEQPDGTFKMWINKKDGNDYGYSPYFYKSGSGWAFNYYEGWRSITGTGPRLEYKSYDLMKSSVAKLKAEYNNLFNN